MILVDSIYINYSGGKVLLDYLVEALEKAQIKAFYLFDARVNDSYSTIPVTRKIYMEASVINRIKFYSSNYKRFSRILCFGNIPPFIKLKNTQVFTYFHNTLILQTPKKYLLKNRIKVLLFRMLVWVVKSNTDKWVVQSSNVASLLHKKLGVNQEHIITIPFYRDIGKCNESVSRSKGFIYASTGASHKNHERLLAAWIELYNEGKSPELHLTIPPNKQALINKIKELNNKGLKIINHGFLPNHKLMELYCQTEFFIFPSLSESFGLPLIEGVESGCKIIASDLPFTFAVVQPSLTFNPYDVNSIKEAVSFSLDNSLPKSKCLIQNKIQLLIEILS